VSHQNLVHSTLARFSYYREPVNSFLLLSPFAFDSSVAGIFWTLCQGGTLTVPSETVLQDPQAIAAWIERYHSTHLLCVPSLYAQIVAQARPPQLSSLRVAIVAGEPCPSELAGVHFA